MNQAQTTTSMDSSSSSGQRPTLRGVVFDMDGTLTKPNIDFAEMYRRCGVDINSDILAEVEQMSPQEKEKALQIIHEMEELGRQTLEVISPGGTIELLSWLHLHNIPIALVTRNTQQTVDVLIEKLQQQSHVHQVSFAHIVARDTNDGRKIPPKPDPTALHIIAKESFKIDLPSDDVLMVGDSISNDVEFGRRAGVKTVLYRHDRNDDDTDDNSDPSPADMVINRLTDLPQLLWKHYNIQGFLGNDDNEEKPSIHGLPPPQSTAELCKAVVKGDVSLVESLLDQCTLEDILQTDDEPSKNTALIWAAETGNAEIVSMVLDSLESKLRLQDQQDEKNSDHFSLLQSYLNHRGYLGATAINRAARRGHTNILELLIKKYQHYHQKFSVDDDTIKTSTLSHLLDHPNDKLQYPLHFAAFKQNPKALQCLLSYGANPWVLDRKGRTPVEDTSCDVCKNILKEAMY
jgi:HAD superfamily hydrolase (TIGR01549 family)